MSGCWLRRMSVIVLTAMVATLALIGCSSGGGLQSLTIEPSEVTMQSRGEDVQLKAIGKKTDGTAATDDDMHLAWTYSDGSIAVVDQSGLLRGVLPGDATVSVKSQTYGMTATIKVHVKSLKFSPADMQKKVQTVIDDVTGLKVSSADANDPAAVTNELKDIQKSLTEAYKYIGQGTNNTLASVELLNAANYIDALAPKTKGSLADALTKDSKLTRQYRDELFAY